MSDTGTPPTIPIEFQQYNSYVEDPKWQIKFTIAWTSALAFFLLLSYSAPRTLRHANKWWGSAAGVLEYSKPGSLYGPLRTNPNDEKGDSKASDSWWSKRLRWGNNKTTVKAKTIENKAASCGTSNNSRPKRLSRRSAPKRFAARAFSVLGSMCYWTPPGIGLNAGQITLISGYLALVCACIVVSAPLSTNSNRAGFLALAQLPPVFLLSSKNSPLSSLLPLLSGLPPSLFPWTRLNAMHRWAGRGVVLAGVVHGGLWIRNHVAWDIPILGEQKETSGVAALGVLGVLALSSLKWVREGAWGVFYWVHFLTYPAFFITVCYHTIYAPPWIIPPIAFYAFDVAMRMVKMRIKDAYLVRVDDQMTVIHIPDVDTGFRAGQHLRMRVFFGGRGVFEPHPLSIVCAPRGKSCVRASDLRAYLGGMNSKDGKEMGDDESVSSAGVGVEVESLGYRNGNGDWDEEDEGAGIVLGVRVVGDWTRALNAYAGEEENKLLHRALSLSPSVPGSSSPASDLLVPALKAPLPIPAQVMFDGPYGGCTLELETYERVLLVAGGSGATFALGLLDELVARCCLGDDAKTKTTNTKTKSIHFVWCVRSFGSIHWFAPLLRAIAHVAAGSNGLNAKPKVELKITVYVTCMCSPEALPAIPGMEVRIGGRPALNLLVGRLLHRGGGMSEYEKNMKSGKDVDIGAGGDETDPDMDMEMCRCGCVEDALAAQAEKAKANAEKAGTKARKIHAQGSCCAPPASSTSEGDVEKVGKGEDEDEDEESGGWWSEFSPRVAVCASGPESLTRDAANAVAGLAGRRGAGGIGLHTEVFAV